MNNKTTSENDLAEVNQVQYTISELSLRLGIKSPTLRKYENHFELYIPRDELGHRFYSQENLEIFQQILTMKAEGANIHAIKKSLRSIQPLSIANGPVGISKPSSSPDSLLSMEGRVTNLINGALNEGVGQMAKMLEASFVAIVEKTESDRESKEFLEIEQRLLAKLKAIIASDQGEHARVYEERLQGIEKAIKADIACSFAELTKQLETEQEQLMEYIFDAINALQRFIVDALKTS